MSTLRFIANKARWVAQTTAMAYTKAGLYGNVLKEANISYDLNDNLSLDGQPSPYIGAAGWMKRNNIILNAGSIDNTRGEGLVGEWQIEIIDIKMRVTQENTIVSTPLVKRKGSIKEFVQARDYVVEMEGSLIANSKNAFPLSDLSLLRQILEKAGNISVASVYLNQGFGITKLAYRSGSYDQTSSEFANALSFNLTFESDEDYELIVED